MLLNCFFLGLTLFLSFRSVHLTALEAQAVGRVHRLGQKRPVEIVHLVVENSVETRIRSMLKKKFGSSSVTAVLDEIEGVKNGDDDEQKEDKKPAARTTRSTRAKSGAVVPMVGSIATDRATVMESEFDELFGVEETEVAPPVPDNASSSAAAAAANDDDDNAGWD